MITILSQPASASETIPAAAPSAVPPADEYELVMGTRQMAGLGFVVIAAVALFSGVSYLAGKAAVELSGGPLPPILLRLPQPEPPQLSVGDQFAMYAASLPVKEPETPVRRGSEGPLFGDPQPGTSYMQMAAVDRGVAAVFVEGLRTHGLPAFAAPVPNNSTFRVLIGPLTDPQSYQKAKADVEKMGLSTFARQYQK